MHYAATVYDQVYKYIASNYARELSKANIDFRVADKDLGLHSRVQTLVSGTYDKSIQEAFPNLKNLIIPYAGMNKVEISRIRARSINVFNTTVHCHYVAERALALTLAVMGKIVFYHDNLKNGDWSGRTEKNRISWTSLTHKKVAIYGYGTIGKEIHRLMKPFGVEVGTLDHRNRRPNDVHVFKKLEELAVWSDVFIISVPLNTQTEGRIGETMIMALKDKVLINVARGPVVDETALYEGLSDGILKGYGSDVWFQYPSVKQKKIMPSKYPIEKFDHVVMTPHCGGFEESAVKLRYDDVAGRLIQIAGGSLMGKKL